MTSMQHSPTAGTNIDPAEIAKFEAMAAEWWDLNGKFKPLHMMNPCRLGYIVDQIARIHAEQMGLEIDYRATSAEALAEAGESFDAVLNMEVVEHVPDPAAYLAACARLVKPGGLMACSTINRNPKSFMMAIVGAEHVMRWLPRGTHEGSKFITPDELATMIAAAGLEVVDRKGFVFNPISWSWSISARDLSVNYVTCSVKREDRG